MTWHTTGHRRKPTNRPGRLLAAAAITATTGLLALPGIGLAATGPTDMDTSPEGGATAESGTEALPDHLLEGYWQNFTNDAPAMKLADVPKDYDIVAAAFGTATHTTGEVDFDIDDELSEALDGYSATDFKQDVDTLHDRGQQVILSVGGQDGGISVRDSASADEFADSVHSLLREYDFDGVDIDIESSFDPDYMAAALHDLADHTSTDPIITMAPQTIDVQSTDSEYLQLALDIKDILTVMNTQYYNSGSMLGCDGGLYDEGTESFMTALACTQLRSGLSANQIGLGLPASESAAGSGYVDPEMVNDSLDCLANGTHCGSFEPDETHPDIRGAMAWSINWDADDDYSFADTVGPHLGTLSE